MPVFKIAKGKLLEKVKPIRFNRKEKELQNLIEKNLAKIFDMTFIKTEHPTSHGGRIDTLALDGDRRPVIIEYKKEKSKSNAKPLSPKTGKCCSYQTYSQKSDFSYCQKLHETPYAQKVTYDMGKYPQNKP